MSSEMLKMEGRLTACCGKDSMECEFLRIEFRVNQFKKNNDLLKNHYNSVKLYNTFEPAIFYFLLNFKTCLSL